MQDIEPFFHWRDVYTAESDKRSPFYRKIYSEFQYHNVIYNYYIHPQWDEFGSSTLYLKLLWTDYEHHFAIIELIGEWNDAIYNDIMYLKRNFVDILISEGITKFILITDNVLNFHGDDTSYYEEWIDDISEENGWIVCINALNHVFSEFKSCKVNRYIKFNYELNNLDWRIMKPKDIFKEVQRIVE